ncbi:Fur family transcriptional regulator [Agaribacterium sp. ZY112]|uniref:Fur family transcriptional regulator n=1 Tax=Agaribacterium sp. ZY112 TaxID=3233574 RepID=UPI003524A9A5
MDKQQTDGDIKDAIRHAEAQCLKQNVRLTEKRQNVLAVLLRAGKALSAYDITALYKQQFKESIPTMSIYRILDFLDSRKLAHRLQLANKYVICEHIGCDHEHKQAQFLICEQCQKVKELNSSSRISMELKHSVESSGFELSNEQLEINCICQDCLTDAKLAEESSL